MWSVRRAANPLLVRTKRLSFFSASAGRFESSRSFTSCSGFHGKLAGESVSNESHSQMRNGFHWHPQSMAFDSARGISFWPRGNEKEGESLSEREEENDISSASPKADVDDGVAKVRNTTRLYEVALKYENRDLIPSLKRWLSEGNVITPLEARIAFRVFRTRKLYQLADKVSKWLWAKKPFEFADKEYADRLDIIAKRHGVFKAEKFFNEIPPERKGIGVYRSFLLNCAIARHMMKSQSVFDEMKALGFKLTAFDYNAMLMVCNHSNDKIQQILKMMDEDNIKHDNTTYKILINARGRAGDIREVERLHKKMQREDIKPDADTLGLVARLYVKHGLDKNAENVLDEIERTCTEERRYIIRKVIWPYALLGSKTNADRLWKELNFLGDLHMLDYTVGILTWGKLGKIGKAEGIFKSMLNSQSTVTAKHYNALLKVYLDHGLMSKAEELLNKMAESGIKENSAIIDTLVTFHVNVGDLEQAESMASNRFRKMETTQYKLLLLVLKKYAERGEVANAERVFSTMRSKGYVKKIRMYDALLQAYVAAGLPAYGIIQRVLAEKFPPRGLVSRVLQQARSTVEKPSAKTSQLQQAGSTVEKPSTKIPAE